MKRGQSAVEFLLTYGWVIIVILISVAALAYFGVLSPEERLPKICLFRAGIGCTDFKVNSSAVSLQITNGGAKDFLNVTFSVVGAGPCENDSSNMEDLKDGQTKVFIINCTEKPVPKKTFRREIRMSYTEKQGLSHNYLGKLETKVED